MTRLRCAILDDYLNLALAIADWSKIADRVDVTVFNQPFASPEAAAERAEGFRDHLRDARAHAVSAHAVRSTAQAETPDHLGHAQCRDRHGSRQGPQGGAVRHAMGPRSDRAADHGLDPGTDPQYRPRECAHACRRTLAKICRHRDRRQNARRDRARQAWRQGREAGAGFRHERDRLEPEPDAGEMQGSRRRLRDQGRAILDRRHHHRPCGAGPALARTGRSATIWRA